MEINDDETKVLNMEPEKRDTIMLLSYCDIPLTIIYVMIMRDSSLHCMNKS